MANPFQFFQDQTSSESIHIHLPFSQLFDPITGRNFEGKDGITFMNSGVTYDSATIGGNNTQKTGQLVTAIEEMLYRFQHSMVLYVDSETTLDIGRLADRIDKKFGIDGYFYDNIFGKRFIYKSGGGEFDGTALHNFIKTVYSNYKENQKNKEMYMETPFLNHEKKPITVTVPLLICVDSLSDIRFNEASLKFQDGDIDDGGKKNTRDMQFGNLKRVLMEDAHDMMTISKSRIWWIGQTKDIINMDGKPLEKESVFIRQGKKVSKCPKTILQLPYIGYEIVKGSEMKNQDGGWEYPNPFGPDVVIGKNSKETPDLLKYQLSIFRNKCGVSTQNSITFIGSQSQGILTGLSMYDNLKSDARWGFQTGNPVTHACDLLPDTKFTRKTIRLDIEENKKLFRATTICYQMWYEQRNNLLLPSQYRITPAELYQRIITLGYDWDDLFNTVDFWHDNPNIKVPVLSTRELLRIAAEERVPYWNTKTK